MPLARPSSVRPSGSSVPAAADPVADDDADTDHPDVTLRSQGCRIPTDEDIAEMLTDLLGREVTCRWSPGTHQLPDAGRVAVYSDDADVPVAVALADVAFTCRTGGALVMVPLKGVQEAVDRGEVPEHLGANFAEVVNIMASLLNSDRTPHVRLTQVHERAEPPADRRAARIVTDPARQRVFDVMVEDYGRGRITFRFPWTRSARGRASDVGGVDPTRVPPAPAPVDVLSAPGRS